MMHPGDASRGAPPQEFVNCRCAVLPVVETAKEEDNLQNFESTNQPIDDGPFKPFKLSTDKFKEFASEQAKVIDGLSEDEKSSIRYYSLSGHQSINQHLRNGKKVNDTVLKDIDNLQSAIAAAPPLDKNTILFRGIDFKALGIDVATLPEENTSDAFQYLVGTQINDKGFMSTTVSPKVAKKFSVARLNIQAPAGTTGIYIDSESASKGEMEYILPPGSRLEITKVTGTPNFGDTLELECTLIQGE